MMNRIMTIIFIILTAYVTGQIICFDKIPYTLGPEGLQLQIYDKSNHYYDHYHYYRQRNTANQANRHTK
jgi:hypothetical protein